MKANPIVIYFMSIWTQW